VEQATSHFGGSTVAATKANQEVVSTTNMLHCNKPEDLASMMSYWIAIALKGTPQEPTMQPSKVQSYGDLVWPLGATL
jgi:hypothetical protein